MESEFDSFRKGTDGVFDVTYREFARKMQQNDGDIYNAFAHDLGFQTAYLTENGLLKNVPTNKDGSIDTEALESAVDEKLDNDREWRNYKRWLNEFSDRAVEQHGTATDEDVLRNMQQQPETGKRFKLSFDGKLTVPAAQYTSVDEFHRNSDRLSSEAAAAAQTVADAMMEFARTVAEENGVRARDAVTAINRAFGQRYNAENITEVFRDAGIKLSAEQAQKIQGLYQQAVELPTEYFEAKLMRNVGLQEAGVAVIPSDTSAEVRQILEKQGIRLAEYKAGDIADRIAVLNQQKDMMLTAQKNTATEGGEVQNSIASLPDGTKYVVLDGNIFLNADGTIMTPREAYNALVGQQITLEDGDVITFIKNLHRIKLFNELFKRYPAFSNISDIGAINDVVNKNIVEVFEASSDAGKNIKQHHYHAGIVDFDKRTVLLFDGNTAYRLNLSIANLTDGGKIAYAKEYMEPATADETAKIKRAETARKISPESTLDNSIRNTSGNVNTSGRQNSAVLSSAALDTDEAYLSVAEKYRDGTATEAETEQLRQAVEAAARKSMPNTKIVDENGNPRVVYHQSPTSFNIFKRGVRDGLSGRGIYFSYYGESLWTGNVTRCRTWHQHFRSSLQQGV